MKYREVLSRLVPELVSIFSENLVWIILYGSVARDMATEESDIDIAVILKDYTADARSTMLDTIVELELQYNCIISPVLIDYKNSASGKMPCLFI